MFFLFVFFKCQVKFAALNEFYLAVLEPGKTHLLVLQVVHAADS